MGYDTALVRGVPLSELYRTAYREQRTVVTRNSRIGASCLFRVVHVKSDALEQQLTQLMQELDLVVDKEQCFTRCDRCNVSVEPIEKARVKARVPPYVYETQAQFHLCPSCHRVYWAATHWQRAQRLLARVGAQGGE